VAPIATDRAPHAGGEKVQRFEGGTLAPGAAGDVTVFGTEVEWNRNVNQPFSTSRNSALGGRTFGGGPVATGVGREHARIGSI
jgi:dihydroorotase-like cyclic amidohydrolase